MVRPSSWQDHYLPLGPRVPSCTNGVVNTDRINARMMPCASCVSPNRSGSYEELLPMSMSPINKSNGDDTTSDSEEKGDKSSEKEAELTFWNDDGSCQLVVVERNLCVADLCQLLTLKNHIEKDPYWTLVEHWPPFGIERTLEDHEDVLQAHYLAEHLGSKRAERKVIFRKDFRKYDFFRNPQNYFPPDMVDVNGFSSSEGGSLARTITLQTLLTSLDDFPPVFGHMWHKENNKQVWRKAFFLLHEKKLYYSHKVQAVAKVVRNWKLANNSDTKSSSPIEISDTDSNPSLHCFARLCDYNVYIALNAKNHFRAPTEFGLCLRPCSPSGLTDSTAESTLADGKDLQCLAAESERGRLCWITAMRLAKYGKQLKESYKVCRMRQAEASNTGADGETNGGSPRDYLSYKVPSESIRSRVAMDFTGSVGRIVEDPREARAIAISEGHQWKRKHWKPPFRPQTVPVGGMMYRPPPSGHGLESGVHMVQPWFHSGMTREQATRLLTRHGNVDGVFLVRESQSNPGAFVLSFVSTGKILHSQISPVMDPLRETLCYSIDQGRTKFYDLLQLVEFYQLNSGCLPTRLTYYIVHSPMTPQDDRVVACSF